MAIKSYRDRFTQQIAAGVISSFTVKRLPRQLHSIAYERLELLDRTRDLFQLRSLRSLNLEQLSGDRREQYSIRINRRYRICFIWDKGDAHYVEIIDYH